MKAQEYKATTAAEALKQSKSGKIKHVENKEILSFDADLMIWLEYMDDENLEDAEPCERTQRYFVRENFLPYDPEPVDQELLDAQKRFPVGSWFKQYDHSDCLFQCKEVIRLGDSFEIVTVNERTFFITQCTPSPLWISEPRCCVTDAPKEDGFYLVTWDGENLYSRSIRNYINGGWVYELSPNSKWYALPKQGGE